MEKELNLRAQKLKTSINLFFHDFLFVLLVRIFLFAWRMIVQFDNELANEMVCGLVRDIEVEKQQKHYNEIVRV
jgi:hypothetical protein